MLMGLILFQRYGSQLLGFTRHLPGILLDRMTPTHDQQNVCGKGGHEGSLSHLCDWLARIQNVLHVA